MDIVFDWSMIDELMLLCMIEGFFETVEAFLGNFDPGERGGISSPTALANGPHNRPLYDV
jgi:hypothetical protein